MIAFLVAACIVGLEIVTRKVLFRASKDLNRFDAFGARAATLMKKPGTHVAFVGNSITEHAIDPAVFSSEMNASADVFSADSSHVNTWLYMLRATFWKRGLAPEVVVLAYHDASLDDGARLETGRLAQFFTDRHDWSELFDTELRTLDERADFVVSSVWATYAVRDRLKERLFKLVPGYQKYTTLENDVTRAIERRRVPSTSHSSTHATLERLLEDARRAHTHVVIVAFPTRSAYEVSPEVPALVAKAGMTFLDLRVVPELDHAKHYDDDLHLNEPGRAIYTRLLATKLRVLSL